MRLIRPKRTSLQICRMEILQARGITYTDISEISSELGRLDAISSSLGDARSALDDAIFAENAFFDDTTDLALVRHLQT